MFYLFISIFAFLITLIVHITVYRLLKRIKSDFSITITIFSAGFVLTGIIIFYLRSLEFNYMQLPLTSILIYFLLSLSYIVFFLYSFLVEESPTSTILGLLKKKGKISEKELTSSFSDFKLIDTRLAELSNQNIVRKQKNFYIILWKGKLIASIINFYRKILGWSTFG